MNLLKRLKRKFSIIVALIVLLVILLFAGLIAPPVILGSAATPESVVRFWTGQNEKVTNFLLNKGVLERSSTDLYIEDGYLKFKSKITNNDKLKVIEFNRRLGVSGDYLEGVAIKLDPDSLSKLQPLMPVHVSLDFDNDRVNFFSQGKNLLSPGFSGQNANISTGSGKLSFQANNAQSFNLEIQDPEPVLQYATQSGQLHLSSKLNGLFPILDRVAIINLTVNGKNINGEVKLK
jgi:hypothetical protein